MAAGWINAAHNGTIPNPYKFGKGSSKWPEYTGMSQICEAISSVTGWTLHSGIAMNLPYFLCLIGINSFWGYESDGTWITEFPSAESLKQ
jgi:hypothetical protein